MKIYQVSFIDNEDNCTYKLFATKKEAEEFLSEDWSDEYGDIVSNEPAILNLKSNSKKDIIDFINHLHY